MQKKTFVGLLAITLAVPIGIAFAAPKGSAQSANTDEAKALRQQNKDAAAQQREERKTAFEEQKKQKLQQRCDNIQTRIDTRITRYENNRQMYENVFGNMLARLQRLNDRLKAAGADVTKLEADLIVLKEKINKLFADHDAFMMTLRDSKNVVCDPTTAEVKTDLKTKVGEARKVIATIQQDRLDIKSYYQTTIKADLAAIRKQLEATKGTTEVEDDDEDDNAAQGNTTGTDTSTTSGTGTSTSTGTTTGTGTSTGTGATDQTNQ